MLGTPDAAATLQQSQLGVCVFGLERHLPDHEEHLPREKVLSKRELSESETGLRERERYQRP